ncbi:MAG: glutathione S-transferase, partial [Betaproteobacteria bacterium]|nr:glutathione S-transferase [Betaproteobacteria bacterium]
MPNLKLIYFKMRALAEAPQLMLHYSGTPYSYEMGWDYFGQPWSEVKSSVLYRQLPLLVVNESTEIFQSGAITRYLAGLLGLKPDDA